MAPSESDGGIACQAPCACYSGDLCPCDRVAMSHKSGELLVMCFCDCTACSCNSNSIAAAGTLFGKTNHTANPLAASNAALPAASFPPPDEHHAANPTCHHGQCQQQQHSKDTMPSASVDSSSSSRKLLPGAATLLTLDHHSSSAGDPLLHWQATAAALLQQPYLNVDAVKTNKEQGTLQVFVNNSTPKQQRQQHDATGAGHDPSNLAGRLCDLGLKLKSQEVAEATRAWQRLQQLQASSSSSSNVSAVSEQHAILAACMVSDTTVKETLSSSSSSSNSNSRSSSQPAVLGGADHNTDSVQSIQSPSSNLTDTSAAPSCSNNAGSTKVSCCVSGKNSDSGSCREAQAAAALDPGATSPAGGAAAAAAPAGGAAQQFVVLVGGMTCSMCAGAVEDVVKQVSGVKSVVVNLATNTATIVCDATITEPQHCLDAIQDAGFQAGMQSPPQGGPSAAAHHQQVLLTVGGVTCSMCAAAVQDAVQQVPGVQSVSVNLATLTATIVYDPALTGPRSCMEAMQAAGFEPNMPAGAQGGMHQAGAAAAREAAVWRKRVLWALLLAVPVAVLSMMAMEPNMQAKLEGPHGGELKNFNHNSSSSSSSSSGGGGAHASGSFSSAALPAAGVQHSVVQPSGLSSDSSAAGTAVSPARAQHQAGAAVVNASLELEFSIPQEAGHLRGAAAAAAADVQHNGKLVGGLPAVWLVQLALATGVQFGVGHVFYSSAYFSLKHCRPNMAVLVVLGTTAAYLYSIIAMALAATQPGFMGHVYFESSALIIAFVCLGKWIEARAKEKTGDAVTALLGLAPKTALLVVDSKGPGLPGAAASGGNSNAGPAQAAAPLPAATDAISNNNSAWPSAGCQQVKEVPLELVQVGDVLKVLPGATIPTDGTVLSGISSVDESLITGEALPVAKRHADSLIGGSVNGSGLLLMRVSRVGPDTVLSGIVRLVQEAQANKAAMQVLSDKVAAYFVPVIIALATATFVTWVIIGYGTSLLEAVPSNNWISVSSPWLLALLHAISVLVIACPCALGLATPTVVMVATGVAARHGVLIKGASVLELAHKVGIVVFDKTGTLTQGKCKLQQVLWIQQEKGTALTLITTTNLSTRQGPVVAAVDSSPHQSSSAGMLLAKATASHSGQDCNHGDRAVCTSEGAGPVQQQQQLQLLQLLAAVESGSEHPLAKAVVQYVEAMQQETTGYSSTTAAAVPSLYIEALEAVPGRGVKALVDKAWLTVAMAATCAAPAQPFPVPQTASSELSSVIAPARTNLAASGTRHNLQPSDSNNPMTAGNSGREQTIVLVGNVAWMEDQGVPLSRPIREHLTHLEQTAGATVVVAAVGGMAVALLAIADSVKPEAAGVLKALQRRGVQPWMITGDSRRVATALAKQLRLPLSQVVAEATPAMKVHMVQKLRQQAQRLSAGSSAGSMLSNSSWSWLGNCIAQLYGATPRNWTKLQQGCSAVAMVGDGINDSPALSEADVGMAVGGGADIAAQSADILLMKDNLSDVLVALDISSKAYSRMRWNFIYAYGYNSLAIPLAAGVLFPATHSLFPAWLAALAMAASSVSVVASSLLLRLYTPAKDVRRV